MNLINARNRLAVISMDCQDAPSNITMTVVA